MTAISDRPSAARPSADAGVAMPRNRRKTELLMLAFAIVVVLFAYASTGLGLNGKVPAGLAEYGLAFAVLMLARALRRAQVRALGRPAAAAAGRAAERSRAS